MMRQFGAISKDFERSDSKKHQEISIFLTRSLYIEQILKVNLHMFFPWGGGHIRNKLLILCSVFDTAQLLPKQAESSNEPAGISRCGSIT